MLILEGNGIKKSFGDRLIIDLERIRIYAGDRIGLVGVNGSGKTTLIHLLSGQMEPEEGWVKLYGSTASMSQLEPPEDRSVSPEAASRLKIPQVWEEGMSGGEETRFKFARCVDAEPMLIFADEPTSNVDLEGIELMEDWFSRYNGGVVLVSHDRSFLDRICNRILEIDQGQVKLYKGNYSDYRLQKQQERERAEFEYEQYVNEKKRLEGIITDLARKSKATRKAPKRMGNSEARLHKMGNQKAKAALDQSKKSVKTRISQLEEKEKPRKTREMTFDLAEGNKVHSRIILEGKGLTKAFGQKVIVREGEFQILNGTKTALVGPNGSGKTTLLKMIMNREKGIRIPPGAKVGYFSQDLETLDDHRTILENVMENSIYQENFARTLLARLLFRGEDVHKPVGVLSGGERVKAAFAKIILEDLNLLIMDEPTNYLDITSIEAVEEALQEYDRTLLFVSHDRQLIRSVADGIMTIEDGSIQVFQGSYDEFLERDHQEKDSAVKEAEEQIFVLQNRLSEVVGKLSVPSKKDDVEALNREYDEILEALKGLKELKSRQVPGGS